MPDYQRRYGLFALGLVLATGAAADDKLDANFEALDAAFVEFLAEEAADTSSGGEKDAELLAWLRDWWDPADSRLAAQPEKNHEQHH